MMPGQFKRSEEHGYQRALVSSNFEERLQLNLLLLEDPLMDPLHMHVNRRIVVDDRGGRDLSVLAKILPKALTRSQISRSAIGCSSASISA